MKKNDSIVYNVTEFKNHSNEDKYCDLDRIQFLKHSDSATTVEQTDCSIGYNVTECKNNSNENKYCDLDRIQFLKHNGSATTVEQTDRGSSESK